MKYNRSFYCKKITEAVRNSNKGKELLGSEVRFHDNLDWQYINEKGVWTDVFLEIERGRGSSVFAFTAYSSYASQDHVTGSVPEFRRDLETGLWDLYIHKKYFTQEDVGNLCRKWVELQGPVKGLCLGCNVSFNDIRMGHVFTGQQYPAERLTYPMNDMYGLERHIPIKGEPDDIR